MNLKPRNIARETERYIALSETIIVKERSTSDTKKLGKIMLLLKQQVRFRFFVKSLIFYENNQSQLHRDK